MEILARERHAGLSWIVARNFHEGSCRSVLDRLAPRLELSLSVGFGAPIGKGWIEVQPAAALSGMQSAAGWRALVPSDNIIRPRRQFESMRRFSSYFDERGRIFSNWRRLGPAACSWSPLSGSTFDQAFGAVSGQRVGILCAEWED
jgi:hypothetical protein